MGERILVPFDGSPLSERALERAVTRHPEADIVVLHVIDPIQAVYAAETAGLASAEEWPERMRDLAESLCAAARELGAEHDCEITTAIETGSPARAILGYASEHDIEHVIMGSHGRQGISRLVLGSVAETVMRQSPVPVTIVR